MILLFNWSLLINSLQLLFSLSSLLLVPVIYLTVDIIGIKGLFFNCSYLFLCINEEERNTVEYTDKELIYMGKALVLAIQNL